MALSAENIIAGWDTATGGDGFKLMEEEVVKRIRQWRPAVVVTEGPDPTGQAPLRHLVNQVVLAAAQQAADPQAYPDHLSELGLNAWAPKKLLAHVPEGGGGTITLNTSRLATRLGRSLVEQGFLGTGPHSSRLVSTFFESGISAVGHGHFAAGGPA